MKYRPEWKGRLRITWNKGDEVWWDGTKIGLVWSEHCEGALSPGGMVTNLIWYARAAEENSLFDGLRTHPTTLHRSKDLAIAHLIEHAEQLVTP